MFNYFKKICYIVVAVLFILLCTQLDYRHMYIHLKNTPIRLLVVLVILQGFTQTILAYQYLRVAKHMGEEISFLKMFYINSFGTVVEAITPGVKIGGEAVKIFKLKEATGMSSERSAVLILTQKVISMSMFLILCVISLLYISPMIELRSNTLLNQIISIAITSVIAFLVLRGLLKDKRVKLIDSCSILKSLRFNVFKVLKNIKTEISRIDLDHKEVVIQLVIAFIIWILYPIKLWLIISMFDGSIGFLVIVAITFVCYTAGMIPIFPGGLLGFELTMTALLASTGMQIDHIVFVTYLFRFITFWLVVFISGIFVGGIHLKNRVNDSKKKETIIFNKRY